MFYTYVLYSIEYQKIYIGQSSNLEERIRQHNSFDNNGWTRKYQPWELIYSESYLERQQAMRRERQLKTSRGRKFIWEIIEGSNA
jgi:putative endonuclease